MAYTEEEKKTMFSFL